MQPWKGEERRYSILLFPTTREAVRYPTSSNSMLEVVEDSCWILPSRRSSTCGRREPGGMSQNFVEELARLVDLAPQARVAIDWPAAERELGLQLPSDYKEFAGRFGPGHFQNGYLWIAVPRGVGDRLNFFTSLVQRLEMLRYLRSSGDEIPYPLYPEMGGL